MKVLECTKEKEIKKLKEEISKLRTKRDEFIEALHNNSREIQEIFNKIQDMKNK